MAEQQQSAAPDQMPVARRGATWARALVLTFVAVMTLIFAVTAAPTVAKTIRSIGAASPAWLLVALVAAAASMVAFAALRSRTLAAGGSRIPLRQTLPITYAAGALHTTLPGGTIFSTAYVIRRFRAAGASGPAITFSLAVTGLMSTVTLAALGLSGLVLSGGDGSVPGTILEVVAAVLMLTGLVRISRNPAILHRPAQQILLWVNRLRRRPAETGLLRLRAMFDEFRAVQPSNRDWQLAVLLAAANWLLDLACLAACCAAVGLTVSVPALVLAYTAGMLAASVLPLPGGLGGVESAMALTLAASGSAAASVLAAILLYRMASTGSVVIGGWLVLLAQRAHRMPLTAVAGSGMIGKL